MKSGKSRVDFIRARDMLTISSWLAFGASQILLDIPNGLQVTSVYP